MAAKSLEVKPIIPILGRDILSSMHGGASIELSQKFLKGLFNGLIDIPEKGEKIGASCYFCKEQLVLKDKPYGSLSDGEYIFSCPRCKRRFWVAMI